MLGLRRFCLLTLFLSACGDPTPAPKTATHADPQLSAEAPIGAASNITVNAVRDQLNPVLATIGNIALVVWDDDRHSFDGDLHGAFFDFNAQAIISRFPIVVAPGQQRKPSVAASGTQYLVVYEQGESDTDIWGVYVHTDGTVGVPFLISSTPLAESDPKAAFGASRFMVAWNGQYNSTPGTGGPIYSVRFADGALPGASEVTGDGPMDDNAPAVGFDGLQFVLAWDERQTTAGTPVCIAVRRVPATGTLSGSAVGPCVAPFHTLTSQDRPWVATTAAAGTTAVAWTDRRSGIHPYMARLSNGLALASDADGGCLLTTSANIQFNPVVTPGPSGSYSALWLDTNLSTARIYWANEPQTGTIFPLINPTTPTPDAGPFSYGAATNATGTGMAVAWQEFETPASSTSDVGGANGVPGFTATTHYTYSLSSNAQETPAIASGPLGDLGVWADWRGAAGTAWDIAYVLRASDGGTTVRTISDGGNEVTPAVASAGDAGFLITYVHEATWRALTTNAAGAPQGNSVGLLTTGGVTNITPPAAAYDGTQYVVAGGQGFYGSGGSVYATRVRPNGTLIDVAPRTIFTWTDGGAPTHLAAASNGAGVTLIATSQYASSSISPNVAAYAVMFFADAGTKAVNLGAFTPTDPTVDFDGTQFFVAWGDGRNFSSGIDLFGAHVTVGGTVVEPGGFPLVSGSGDSLQPSLSFNGNTHVLSWAQLPTDGGNFSLQGAVLSLDGGTLGTFTLPSAENQLQPASSSLGGRTAVIYTRWKGAPENANRVFMTSVTWGLGEHCATAADCASGVCLQQGATSICCDRACTGVCESCTATPGTCAPLPANTTCRAANGVCDSAEVCDGVNATCPVDAPAPATTLCRPPLDGGCDIGERCDGISFICPPDTLADAGTLCQNTSLLCAKPATCDGVSVVCPATGVQPADFICRHKADVCDQEEKCDGTTQQCPNDDKAPASVVCRPKNGDCDLPENCLGNDVACPPDLVATSTVLCRAAQPVCDTPEFCTGHDAGCPDDVFAPATQQCAVASSECQEAAVCAGSAAMCSANATKADGTLCESGGGTCRSGSCVTTQRSRYGWKECGCTGGPGGLPLLALLVLRRRRRFALVAASLVLLAAPAFADGPRMKLVFTGISAGAGVSEQTSSSVAEYVQSELTKIDAYRVVSPNDLAAVLGVERQKQLLGCSDASGSCMMELAGALDADRLLRGDLARIDETIVMNLSLIDLRKGEQVARVGRRVESGGVSAALREIQPMLYELLNQAPEHKKAPLVLEKGFAFITVGLRGDADVLARGIAPAVFAEIAWKYFGAAATVIATTTPGGRLEMRYYPITTPLVRPYLGVGAVVFTTGFGVHAGGGASLKLGHIVLSLDAAFEEFLAPFVPGYSPHSVIIGLGAGYAF